MRGLCSWRLWKFAVTPLAIVMVMGALGSSALASASAPGWEVSPGLFPSTVAPGGSAYIVLPIYNVGRASSSGSITVTDRLPAGLTAVEAGYQGNESGLEGQWWKCSLGAVVVCMNNPSILASFQPAKMHFLDILVKAATGVSGSEANEVTVSGGGAAAPASASDTITYGTKASSFGFESLDGWFSNADGTLDTQAGSHPYSLTVSFFLNNEHEEPVGQARDVVVDAPPGLVGNPQTVPRCTRAELNGRRCPADTQVGIDQPSIAGVEETGEGGDIFAPPFPVYNMVPPPGAPAEFGFSLFGAGARLDAAVRSGSDYGITERIKNIPQYDIIFNSLTLWGIPGDTSHDYQRCTVTGTTEACGYSISGSQEPLLTLPTSCAGPQVFSAFTDSWAPQGTLESGVSEIDFHTHDEVGLPTGFTGCDHLSFSPSLRIAPDTTSADTPAGLTVDVKMPQEGLVSPEGLSMSDIKDTTVTLPAGVVINPGQATGLQTCSAAQSAVGTESAPACPSASKVGTDQIETPLLPHKLEGDVYVLASNPPNLKLLVAASGEGVNLKLLGDVHLDEQTGRLTTTFTETPELPFTDFKLSFSGGAQAALSTPLRCGTYTSGSDFTPWSSPQVPDQFPSTSFAIEHGPGGGACPSAPLPFTPSLTAGSTTDQAGGFTDFSLLLTRGDGQQRISSLRFQTPEGLLGMISKVALCQEPQATEGDCSSDSQIGHTTVEAGPGPYPLVVPEPGRPPAPIYLTGPYKGAPYGLSIVVPVVVGPFDLGRVVVRARIAVDPVTTRLTVTTDPLPLIIDGVPTDLRAINAVIDKPGFMFNPTGCEPSAFSGEAFSGEGASASLSSRFQMGSCRSLTFKPSFKVSTNAKTSRANGASLDAKILYPKGPFADNQASVQSNVKSVKVDLPKLLPSRLTTLQKACPAHIFEANPAGCPAGSRVGQATAVTPVLPVTLSGPAYFVSYGGAKFPELVIVLQGYGVTVDLHGETFINEKTNITSSTFRQVPDVPIESFELKLPQGANSALAAIGNLCSTKLKMPTVFTGQNGEQLKQSTPIAVNGCPKHKAKPKRKKK